MADEVKANEINEGAKGETPSEPTNPSDFRSFIETQGDDVKALYEKDVQGLKSALESERTTRKALEKQLREAAKEPGMSQEAQAKLNEYADKLKGVESQLKFYDFAHAAGIKNLKLGWLAAQEFMTDEGSIDSEGMLKAYPELFETSPKVPSTNAGAGTGTQKPAPVDMNAAIRKAAGLK